MKPSAHWSSRMLWIIYLALLAVLLPHTAWAFARFESPSPGWLGVSWGIVTAWAAAFAFEAAIAALTHKLAGRIGGTPRYTAGRVLLRRVSRLWLTLPTRWNMVASLPSLAGTVFHRCSIRSRLVASCLWFRSCLPGSWVIPPKLRR
jgi:hypothetical protein